MNKLSEFNYLNDLYDIYRLLLTKRQILVMDNYYKFNLSLSEISSNLKISRSAVLDCLKHARKKLKEYEKKLHLLSKNNKIKEILKNSEIEENVKKNILEELYYGV